MRPLSTMGLIILVIIAATFIANIPEIQRYLRMRDM